MCRPPRPPVDAAPGTWSCILAGKGHNGDDARCAREHLTDRRVEVFDVTETAADLAKLDALLALRPALLVDGLFGIGLDRPLGPDWVSFIERVNAARLPVLAVDVPSGLNADTGEPQGAAIKASVTLTVGAPKTGLLREVAWPFVGRLEVASDVGLAPCPHQSELQWTLPEDFAGFPPARAAATHKGNYGHLAIVAGSLGYHGAAVLAARGAQRAQPGLITLHTHGGGLSCGRAAIGGGDGFRVVAAGQAVRLTRHPPARSRTGGCRYARPDEADDAAPVAGRVPAGGR